MIRAFIIFFNFLGLIILHFFGDPVTLDETIPASVKAGSEFTVTVNINKGSVSNFARFQHELPDGFTATPLENDGADFRFEAQKVKFIWSSLPSAKVLKISYKIKVADNVSGDQVINSKFSYLADGNSATVTATHTVHVEGNGPATTTNNTPPDNTQVNPNTTVNNNTPKVDSVQKPPAVISCVRTVPGEPVDKEFTVELKLNKANVTGFAKLEDELPAGCTATSVSSANAEFKFEKQKVKFIWVSLPADDKDILVSYHVTVDPSVKNDIKISGIFSYIENEEPKKFYLNESTVRVKSTTEVASNSSNTPTDTLKIKGIATNTQTNPVTDTKTQDNKTPDTKTNDTQTTDKGLANNGTKTPDNTVKSGDQNPVANIPGSEKGVTYKVQIMALHRSLESAWFTKTYGITENIAVEMHEGYTKYVVGGFNEYKSARDHREEVRNKGVVGPFVTAYNTGKRITVQEALMISNQKWVR